MCLSATEQRGQYVKVLPVLRLGDSFVARMNADQHSTRFGKAL